MPKITNNQMQGNAAEHFIAYALSEYCLVRPVSSGTDFGIDLYCEYVKEQSLLFHFWVQVKSKTKERKCRNWKGVKGWLELKPDTIAYWNRQDIPVCVMVPIVENKDGHICKFAARVRCYFPFVEELRYNTQDSIPDRFQQTLIDLSDPGELRAFLDNVLPELNSIIKRRHGVIAPIETTDPQMETKFPYWGSLGDSKQIHSTIRASCIGVLHDAIDHLMRREDLKSIKGNIKLFGSLLECTIFRDHWDSLTAMAVYHLCEGKTTECVKLLQDSNRIIENDPHIDKSELCWVEALVKNEWLLKFVETSRSDNK